MNKNSPILISLVLFDCGGIGHNYEYVNAVCDATTQIDWRHYAALPSNFNGVDLKENWNACLVGCRRLSNHKENLFLKTIRLTLRSFKLAKSIHQYLYKCLSAPDNSQIIIFIDSFKPPELLAFVISLLFLPKKQLIIWLLYRHDDYQKKIIGIFYKIMNNLIEINVSKQNFVILTDSEKLNNSLTKYFNRQIYVMPIPHTQNIAPSIGKEIRSITSNSDDSSILAWWCGNPNPEKGLAIIQRLVTVFDEFSKQFNLFLSEATHISNKTNDITLTFLPAYLTRQQYLEQLSKIDILLLPYNSNIYKERTSGVFVEGVCAGKIPFVTQGTWMATELIKYNLSELIIDWEQNDVITSIYKLAKDSDIQRKVTQMQNVYVIKHSILSYSQCMKEILLVSNQF